MQTQFDFRLFIAGCLSFLILGGLMPLFGLALPGIEQAFDLPESGLGFFQGAQAAGSFVVLFAAAMGLSGLRWRTGLIILAIGGALVAWHPTFAVVLAGSLILGIGYGTCGLIINRRFMDEFGTNGPGMVGFINAVFGLGAILGPLVFLALGNNGFACFGVAAVVALMVAPVVKPRPATGTEEPAGGLPKGRLWVMIIPVLAVSVEVGSSAFGPKALIEFGMAENRVAWLVTAFFATYLFARLAMGWATRFVDVSWLMLGALLAAAAGAGLAQAGFLWTGFIVLGAAVSLFFPAFYVWGSRLLGDDPRGSAAIMAAGIGGASVLTPVLGAIIGFWGQGALFPTLAATSLALVVIVTVTRRIEAKAA